MVNKIKCPVCLGLGRIGHGRGDGFARCLNCGGTAFVEADDKNEPATVENKPRPISGSLGIWMLVVVIAAICVISYYT